MAEKKIFTKEQMKVAQEIASAGGTRQQITDYLKVNRAVVDRLLREGTIILTPSRKNTQGQKYEWTPEKIERLKEMYASDRYSLEDIMDELGTGEGSLVRKARELGIKKVRKAFWQPEDDQYLRDNITKVKTVKELAEAMNLTEDTICDRLKFLGIYEQRPIKMRASLIRDELFANPDFMAQFENPTYSHERIGRIWGISGCTVNKWRRQKFGSWQTLNDTYRGKTTAEMDFENILRELDLAYLYEHKIGKWKIDYYLGHHIVAEVQGEYWHSLDKTIKTDAKKKKYLESKGYMVLYILEEELHSEAGRKAIKERILFAIKEMLKL